MLPLQPGDVNGLAEGESNPVTKGLAEVTPWIP